MINPKQEKFCREYIIDLNATQAAIRAGYSEKTARQVGSENLSKPYIADRIAELQKEAFERCDLDADYVLKKFKKIADDDIANYLSFGMEGEQMVIKLKDSADIDTWNISEISMGKDGQFKFKTHCKDNALLQLGKHLNLFTDKIDVNVSGDVNVRHTQELYDKYLADEE